MTVDTRLLDKLEDEALRSRNTPPLSGRCAIVTGSTMGLGAALRESLTRAGADVIPCARSLGIDISRDEDVRALVSTAIALRGRIDILVNNAAVHGPIGPFAETDFEQWIEAVNVNLIGSARLMRHVLPHMKRQRYGKIIQLAGGGATDARPNFSAYAASKTALVRLTETLAAEVREWGIDVNAVSPGSLETRLLRQATVSGEDVRAITPVEVPCELIGFLASSASDGITGKLISAPWDEWRSFPVILEELLASEAYTLRRVTPEARGAAVHPGVRSHT